MEANPGELQTDWEHQGFSEEEAAVKSFGALTKQPGVLPLDVRRRLKSKKRTQLFSK
jgi:hypothetical protein